MLAIDEDALPERRAVHDELQAGALERRPKVARQVRREGREIGLLVDRFDSTGLDAREVEQRVDELQEAQGVSMQELEAPAPPRRSATATRACPRSGPA